MHFRTRKVILNNTKLFDFFEKFEIFLEKNGSLYVSDDFESV